NPIPRDAASDTKPMASTESAAISSMIVKPSSPSASRRRMVMSLPGYGFLPADIGRTSRFLDEAMREAAGSAPPHSIAECYQPTVRSVFQVAPGAKIPPAPAAGQTAPPAGSLL